MNIEKLSAAKCREALDELAARRREITARLAAIRPPRRQLGAPGPTDHRAPRPDPLAGAGPEFRRVALEGSAEEMAELVRQRETLDAEVTQIDFRRHALDARRREAVDDERRRAAPGQLKRLIEGADGVLDELDRARAVLRAAEQAKSAHFHDLARTRDLVGADAPGLSPLQVRRLVADEKGDVWWLRRNENGEIVHNEKLLAAVRAHLKPVPTSLIERLRRRFRVSRDQILPDYDDAGVRDDVARMRCKLIAEAEYSAANDFERIAQETVKNRFRHSGDRPTDAQVDRWLTPTKAKITK